MSKKPKADHPSVTNKMILVTGDVVCDHDFYRGNRARSDSLEPRGFRMKQNVGGAGLLHRLIDAIESQFEKWEVLAGETVNTEKLPSQFHAYCHWEPQLTNLGEKDATKRFEVWRAVLPTLGYGQKEVDSTTSATSPWTTVKSDVIPTVAVIDDAGLGFRDTESTNRWPDFLKQPNAKKELPKWIVLKLSGTLGEGELWNTLATHFSDRLVVVVSSDLLRRSEVRISRGLSWEATAEDLVSELHSNLALAPLKSARHLIVTFRSDGAFWIDNESGSPTVVFDGDCAEGEWETSIGKGGVFGLQSCMTAAIAHQICRFEDSVEDPKPGEPDFELALESGLSASRRLRLAGNGRVQVPSAADKTKLEENPDPGFPVADVAKEIIAPTMHFSTARVPPKMERRGEWMMLDELQVRASDSSRRRPHSDLAFGLAVLGPRALERFPVARFGALRTVDRQEIECLRSLRQIMEAYENGGPQKKPLNLGVFGPPGAGKSFGVTEISKAVFGNSVRILTFNLSQFDSAKDLIGAFHQVRDAVLTGKTPVVFWDEFDSQNYRWLQYLLAPMQDGVFQEGQINHPIGKCIFVFAGATSPTYQTFGPLNPDDLSEVECSQLHDSRMAVLNNSWIEFVLAKGPDFRTRLAGHLNVLGPNPRQKAAIENGIRRWHVDPIDLFYPIRRAFFIRSQFKLEESQRLPIDHGVLRSLLEISHFKAGARSLEFLCQQLRQALGIQPGRSAVPGREMLQMHVDSDRFWELCERHHPFMFVAEKLAGFLHEGYRLRIRGRPEKKHLDVKLANLDADLRAANFAQAMRIPENLRLTGMCLVPGPVVVRDDLRAQKNLEPGESEIRAALNNADNLELLAEAEHNGWMVERMLQNWRYGRVRDDSRKVHPLLIPYSQLSELDKSYDQKTIVGTLAPPDKPELEEFGYVDVVKMVGFRVRRIRENATEQ